MNHKVLKKWHHGSSPGQTVASLAERERVAMEVGSYLRREGSSLEAGHFPHQAKPARLYTRGGGLEHLVVG